jgi:hypothetical protein
MYSHFEEPNGGRANDGNGFNSIVGNGVSGARPTDGKSKLLSQISCTLQLYP